jgi:hypothetical protein
LAAGRYHWIHLTGTHHPWPVPLWTIGGILRQHRLQTTIKA